MNKIIIYCDGGCRGNQNKGKDNVGGYGVVFTQGKHAKIIKGWQRDTTNNVMELMATIRALETVKRNDVPVEVYIDSAYVLNGITSWIEGWVKRNWKTKDNSPVKNKELWQRLHQLKKSLSNITFYKVKGHNGVEFNEIADQLANEAMDEAMEELNINKQNGEIEKYVDIQNY